MHGLLSFFHLAVQHSNVTVDDADVLRCGVGILGPVDKDKMWAEK